MTEGSRSWRENVVSESSEIDVDEAEARQYVVFSVGEEAFAVDMAPVQEIIRVPAIVKVPLAPESLVGLANLRGDVLPIISLRCIFGLKEREYDEATRAIVINTGQPIGFVVDKVVSVVAVEESQIGDIDSIRTSVDVDLLSGVLMGVSDRSVTMVLDFEKLISKQFSNLSFGGDASADSQLGFSEGQGDIEEEEESDEVQLVSFNIAGQEYGIDIQNVQEIVQVPENIVRIPNARAHELGIVTLRDRLLPIVSLRQIFGLPLEEITEQNRIVVVSLGSASVGIVTDFVNEVLRVARDDIEPIPSLLSKGDDATDDIKGICRLDDGKRLVSIVSVENLFRRSEVKEALGAMNDMNEKRNLEESNDYEDEDEMINEEQMVVFYLDKEEFGVPIENVQEILRVPEDLTFVPKAPSYVEGVTNLRGMVLPVIDLRKRLGMPVSERSDRQRIIVFLINGIRTGFIVDSVTEVLSIPKDEIEPTPKLFAVQSNLLPRMANIKEQNRMMQIIEVANLLEDGEFSELTELIEKQN